MSDSAFGEGSERLGEKAQASTFTALIWAGLGYAVTASVPPPL